MAGFPETPKPKPGYEDITWEDKNWGEYIGAIGERMEQNKQQQAEGPAQRKGTTAAPSLAAHGDRVRKSRGVASSILSSRSGLAAGQQVGRDTLG